MNLQSLENRKENFHQNEMTLLRLQRALEILIVSCIIFATSLVLI